MGPAYSRIWVVRLEHNTVANAIGSMRSLPLYIARKARFAVFLGDWCDLLEKG